MAYDTKLINGGNPKGQTPQHRAVIQDLMVVLKAPGKSRYDLAAPQDPRGMGDRTISLGNVNGKHLSFTVPTGADSRQGYIFYPPDSVTLDHCVTKIRELEQSRINWRALAKEMKDAEEKAKQEAKKRGQELAHHAPKPVGPPPAPNPDPPVLDPKGPVKFEGWNGTSTLPPSLVRVLLTVFPPMRVQTIFGVKITQTGAVSQVQRDRCEIGEFKPEGLRVMVYTQEQKHTVKFDCLIDPYLLKQQEAGFVDGLRLQAQRKAAEDGPKIKPTDGATGGDEGVKKPKSPPAAQKASSTPADKKPKEKKGKKVRGETGWRGITGDPEKAMLVLKAIFKIVGTGIFWPDEHGAALEPLLPESMQGADPRSRGKSFSSMSLVKNPFLSHQVKQGKVPSHKINGYKITEAGLKFIGEDKKQEKKAEKPKPAKTSKVPKGTEDTAELMRLAAPALAVAPELAEIESQLEILNARKAKLLAKAPPESTEALSRLKVIMQALTVPKR